MPTTKTTVADQILLPDGNPASGIIYITANSQFVADQGEEVYQIPVTAEIDLEGNFSVELYPNDTTTPSGTSYSAQYSLNGPPGMSLQVPKETWVVPTSGSPVGLSVVRTSPPPSPGVSGYITSLNGLTAVTQVFARTNDTNVTLTINSVSSTHTFVMGWQSTLSAARGGTGGSSAAATGVPMVTSGVWSYDADAADLAGWPSGVSMTEVGYLDGVTSAIQTQLNAKANSSALSSYLPLAGGTVTGDTEFGNGSDTLTVDFIADSSQGSTSIIRVFGQSGALATQFDGDGVLNTFDSSGTSKKQSFFGGNDLFASDVGISWKDQTSIDTPGSFDSSLSRLSAGVLYVHDGSGNLRDIKARNIIAAATSADDSKLANSQFMLVLTSNTNLQVRAKGSDGVVRTANITLA